jgi:Methyltransferase domain
VPTIPNSERLPGFFNMIDRRKSNRSNRSLLWLLAALVVGATFNALLWLGVRDELFTPSLRTLDGSPVQRLLHEMTLDGSPVQRLLHEMKAFAPQHSACPSLSSYFEMTALQLKTEENIDFHQRGGNLKSVQNFLDGAIDTTLDKHDIKFIPQGETQGVRKASQHLKQFYQTNPSKRRGYGEALPGKYSDENPKIVYEKRYIDVIEPRKRQDKWDASLGPIGPNCKNLVELGGVDGMDGNKFICLPENQSSSQHGECHVISVGGNDSWTFEEAIVKELGCTTYTFDCTLPNGKPQHKPDNDKIRFFEYCIDGHTHEDATFGSKYLSYEDMLKVAGIDTAPTYFKIDVEGFEYDILTDMMRTPHLLPLQIQIELHWATRMTDLPWMQRTRSAGEIALLSGMLYNSGGYMPVKLDFNGHCTSCMEVLYFRTSCTP